MARKRFGSFDTARVLVRVACAALSLVAVPHARGAETVPGPDSGPSHGVVVDEGL